MNFYAALHGARKKTAASIHLARNRELRLAARNFPARRRLSPNVPLVTDKNSTRRGVSAFRRHRIAILLAITVALMTALSMEQQRVIQAQGAMIQTLSRDSFAYLHWLAEQRRQQHK